VIICGVEIKGKEAILALVKSDDDDNLVHINCATKRLALNDDRDASALEGLKKAITAFANENKVECFAMKARQSSGQLASGGITFKIETLFQLSGTTVEFVSAPTLAAFSKKSNIATPPRSVNKYQTDAYRAAAWKLAKL
jgi:Protein of unknown function (DUF3010)